MVRENLQQYKVQMQSLIADAVCSQLVTLSDQAKRQILSGQTLEQLIESCSVQYGEEFDMLVDSLGVAGAHELAWKEMLADFNEDSWC